MEVPLWNTIYRSPTWVESWWWILVLFSYFAFFSPEFGCYFISFRRMSINWKLSIKGYGRNKMAVTRSTKVKQIQKKKEKNFRLVIVRCPFIEKVSKVECWIEKSTETNIRFGRYRFGEMATISRLAGTHNSRWRKSQCQIHLYLFPCGIFPEERYVSRKFLKTLSITKFEKKNCCRAIVHCNRVRKFQDASAYISAKIHGKRFSNYIQGIREAEICMGIPFHLSVTNVRELTL